MTSVDLLVRGNAAELNGENLVNGEKVDVDIESQEELKAFIENFADNLTGTKEELKGERAKETKEQKQLRKNLEKRLNKSLRAIFSSKEFNIQDMKQFVSGLGEKERQAVLVLLKEYKGVYSDGIDDSSLYQEKIQEYNEIISGIQRELHALQTEILGEHAAYQETSVLDVNRKGISQIEKRRGQLERAGNIDASQGIGQDVITNTDMKALDLMLNGKGMALEGRFSGKEKDYRRDFKKFITLLQENTGLSFKGALEKMRDLVITGTHPNLNPDWDEEFPKKEAGEKWSYKEKKKLADGLIAYFDAHQTPTEETIRWNTIISTIETKVLNQGLSLSDTYQSSLNAEISKKERKQGIAMAREQFEALSPDSKAWIDQYLKEHQAEIAAKQQEWHDAGYTNISKLTRDYLESQYNHRWKNHLKELKKQGIQESDLGKYSFLVDAIKEKSVQDKILALMTDTNFDGMRNHLDSFGLRTGLAVHAAFLEALQEISGDEGLSQIIENIVKYMEQREPGVFGGVDVSTPENFSNWLASDIIHARKLQSTMFDSPADPIKIMLFGTEALKKTIESTGDYMSSNEELSQIIKLANQDNSKLKIIKDEIEDTNLKSNFDSIIGKIKGLAASTGNGESIKISSDEATIVKLLVLEDDSLDNRQKRELMASINRRIDVEEVARGVQEKIDSEFSDILSPAERESLQATLSDLLLGAMKEQPTNVDVNGLGLGLAVSLDSILKGLNLTLGVGASKGEDVIPYLGVGLSWNTNIVHWKGGRLTAGVFGKIGANADDPMAVIPIVGVRTGIELNNEGSIVNNLRGKSKKTVSFGVNASIIGVIPSYGASIGVDNSKLEGINDQYNILFKDMEGIIYSILTNKDFIAGNDEEKISKIKSILSDRFKKASEEDLNAAADKIMSALRCTRGLGAQKNESLDPRAVSKIIGETYAKSWRNNEVRGLSTNLHISGGSIGIQFIAGFIPVPSWALTFEKYRKAVTVDDAESLARERQRIDYGYGNEVVDRSTFFSSVNVHLKNAGILGETEKGLEEQNGFIVVPSYLTQKIGLDISIAKSLVENYIKKDEQGNFLFPKSLTYRFLKADRAKGAKNIINIGTNIGTESSVKLTIDTEQSQELLDYDTEQYFRSLERKISALGFKNLQIRKGKIVVDGKDYPLQKNQGVKLTVENDNVIEVEFIPNSKDISVVHKEAIKTADTENLLVDTYFTPTVLADIRNSGWTGDLREIGAFYANTSVKKHDYIAIAEDFENHFKNNAHFDDIRKALEVNDGNFKDKQLAYQIIDRLKAVFATIDDNRKDTKTHLTTTVRGRESRFTHSEGVIGYYTGISALNGLKYSNFIPEDVTPQDKPNLVGFTAFYRGNAAGGFDDARGMSMTAIGQTSVLGDVIQFPNEDQSIAAKNWIIERLTENGTSNEVERQILSSKLGPVVDADCVGKYEGLDGNKLGKEAMKTLLSTGEVTLEPTEGNESLGKKIIKLNATPVMYFLAECGNESIGIDLGEFTISDEAQDASAEEGLYYRNLSGGTTSLVTDANRFSVSGVIPLGPQKGEEEWHDGDVESGTTHGPDGDNGGVGNNSGSSSGPDGDTTNGSTPGRNHHGK